MSRAGDAFSTVASVRGTSLGVLAALIVAALALTGCVQHPATDRAIPEQDQLALMRWQSALDHDLADPALEDSSAAGFTQGGGTLGAPAGQSAFVAACTGVPALRFTLSSTSTGRSVAAFDVTCGAEKRVDVRMDRVNDLSFAVEAARGAALPEGDRSTETFWYASVVSPGFSPDTSAR